MIMSRSKGAKYKKVKAVLRENPDDPCIFCNRVADDELVYGNMYTLQDISCHYFCVVRKFISLHFILFYYKIFK